MTDIRFSQAAGAYKDALRAAENIIQKTGGTSSSGSTDETASANGPSFADLIGQALGGAASTGYKSEAITAQGLTGKASISDVVSAVNEAETALNTVVAIRDKVISAYNDILKMQI